MLNYMILDPSRIMHFALAIASSFLLLLARWIGIAMVLRAKALMRCLSRTNRIMAFQMTKLDAPSNLS